MTEPTIDGVSRYEIEMDDLDDVVEGINDLALAAYLVVGNMVPLAGEAECSIDIGEADPERASLTFSWKLDTGCPSHPGEYGDH